MAPCESCRIKCCSVCGEKEKGGITANLKQCAQCNSTKCGLHFEYDTIKMADFDKDDVCAECAMDENTKRLIGQRREDGPRYYIRTEDGRAWDIYDGDKDDQETPVAWIYGEELARRIVCLMNQDDQGRRVM